MKTKLKTVPGSIVAARGFKASGVFCDIKTLGTGAGSNKGAKRDLALIFSERPAAVAGMFTTNQVCAAPVKLCIERTRKRQAQAIVANSGNANACTGRQGMEDAREMASFAEQCLKIPSGLALVGSTGRIGLNLPMDHVRAGIVEAAVQLGSSPGHAANAAEAIMTSDTRAKAIAVEFRLGGKTARLGGICKGAGMIQPIMTSNGARTSFGALHATMLCFLTTDAAVTSLVLQKALGQAVSSSFNRITVDGDMSTNDTVLILANGAAQNAPVKSPTTRDALAFQAALDHVCLELAKMIVRDGEGVSHVVTVRVTGARSVVEADAAARAVANSALVKTSWHGGDPNWGRIMDALGYSRARVVESKVDLGYSRPGAREILWSLRRGQPTRATFKELCAAVAPNEFDLHINLNLGSGQALIYAADLTEEYVAFNKGDVSDPASLGG
ncbi:MAG TPA: bifunctional glutamate N-acetyltransferase/amino-acid acetyltransferase ArgJ [Verrucomicrobiae bacterium]|nr:bifunctional glutamate N-acetyltransferase/amino-acid acetyltransferase ArgJ [Verrucomicrobiae bacterium]